MIYQIIKTTSIMKKEIKIGLPCSPAKMLSNRIIEVVEILISYGGGMGGASQKYYATKQNGNEFTLFTGEVITLYPNFIVSKRNVKLIEVVTDVTTHSNYHEKTCKSNINYRYFKVNFGDTFSINETKYIHHTDSQKPIFKFSEIIK